MPTVGVVGLRLQGRPEDVADAIEYLSGLPVPVVLTSDREYADRNGVTVRRFATLDIGSEKGP